MCLLCIEFQRSKMTLSEFKRNLRELIETIAVDNQEDVQHYMALHMAEDEDLEQIMKNAVEKK